jgi:oxygen-independent coproporphyrinogen-3 oxidase
MAVKTTFFKGNSGFIPASGRIFAVTGVCAPGLQLLADFLERGVVALAPAVGFQQVADDFFEFLLNALRLRHGFELPLFEKRTGVTFSEIEKTVEFQISQGLLVLQSGRLRTTDRGYRVLNSILEEFLD